MASFIVNSKGLKMIYFALNSDGLIYNLGDHGDWEAADETSQDMMLEPIWLLDEFEAQNWATFIQDQIREARKAMEVL
jgi:hypothetical protein